jgi:hypothetical protein
MKPKRGGKNAHKELKQQVRGCCMRHSSLSVVFVDIAPPSAAFVQRKSAWEATSAGAGDKEKAPTAPKEGGNRGARSGHNTSAAGGGSSLPSVEEMHPSWAARVKQQDAIKVHLLLRLPAFDARTPPPPLPPSLPPSLLPSLLPPFSYFSPPFTSFCLPFQYRRKFRRQQLLACTSNSRTDCGRCCPEPSPAPDHATSAHSERKNDACKGMCTLQPLPDATVDCDVDAGGCECRCDSSCEGSQALNS